MAERKGGLSLWRFDVIATLVLFAIALGAEYRELFALMEEQTLSVRQIVRNSANNQPQQQLHDQIMLVTMDEAFFRDYGSYPLKRSDIARLVDSLHQLGASVIALDILFDFASSYDEDPILAQSLAAAGNVLLVSQAQFERGEFQQINYPVDSLSEAAARTGYTNIQSMSALVSSMSRLTIYPDISTETDGWPFAVQALSMHRGVEPRWDSERRQIVWGEGYPPVRLDQRHNLYIDYVQLSPGSRFISETYGLTALEFLDLSDYYPDELAELRHWIEGKMVIVGDTSEVSHDIFTTPVGQVYGMEIIANTINSLMHGAPLQPLPFAAEVGVALLLMGLILLSIGMTRPLWRTLYTVGVVVLFLLSAVWIYAQWGLVASISYNLLAALLSMVAINIRFYLQERNQKALISGIFGHYLSPDVIKVLVNNPDKLALGGERREMTAFFSDIASFSSFSEQMSPEELVHILNEYLTAMCDIIIAHGGIIDKFEGDAIIAFWGAPLERQDHALQAALASIRMQQFMQHFSEQIKAERGFSLSVRMGVNSGPMVVGNMGSKQRMDYTIMGDAVNLASRLEGANKFFGSKIMISEQTRQLAGEQIVTRYLDTVQVVGKKEPVIVYEVMGVAGEIEPSLQQLLDGYQQGIDLYRQRDFTAAAAQFARLLQQFEGDGPSRTYLQRCHEFIKTPPAVEWDGVTILSSKG
ncbi:adenylate/guanylate cyclase domain-containing protein [Ectothiorhodospiraceae bacterium BW-2]|nr:adenylate/guanylate cyclase domain-containing protein [Ectothiorhodospiraceae bacterium BW-2]